MCLLWKLKVYKLEYMQDTCETCREKPDWSISALWIFEEHTFVKQPLSKDDFFNVRIELNSVALVFSSWTNNSA